MFETCVRGKVRILGIYIYILDCSEVIPFGTNSLHVRRFRIISRGRVGLKDKIYSFFHKLGRYPAKGWEQRERAQHCLFTFSLLFFQILSPLPLFLRLFSPRIHDIFPSHPVISNLFSSSSFLPREFVRAHRWTKIRAEE